MKKFAAIETFVAETGQNDGNDEWASFLELIGMKDSKLKLKPISPEYDIKDMLTVTYHVAEDMLPFTAILDDDRACEMYVDDQVAKPFKKKVTFKKAGDHVIRLFASDRFPYKLTNCLNYEGSELIKIPDSMTNVKPAKFPDYGTFRGSRKLLLGAGYTGVEYIGSFKLERLPENDFEELDVVGELLGELVFRGELRHVGLPSWQFFIYWFDAFFNIVWEVIYFVAVLFVSYTCLDSVETIEYITLHHDEFSNTIYHDRVFKSHEVYPSAATLTTCNSSIFMTKITNLFTSFIEKLCWEWSCSYACAIGFHDTIHIANFVRTNS